MLKFKGVQLPPNFIKFRVIVAWELQNLKGVELS